MIESRLNPEENDSKRNFVSLPASSIEKQPYSSDEISFQLSFRFTCGNSFKVLIGVGLCLAIGWNIYATLNSRSTVPSQVPTLPQPSNFSVQ
ncbi:hypothetical protein IFO70_12770 [Phormidium tenue FACHB-886]|nr:hypothetical protein [Phormidium tenue FACHB-886]